MKRALIIPTICTTTLLLGSSVNGQNELDPIEIGYLLIAERLESQRQNVCGNTDQNAGNVLNCSVSYHVLRTKLDEVRRVHQQWREKRREDPDIPYPQKRINQLFNELNELSAEVRELFPPAE
ncbi:MAG: hypothetical protein KDD03_00450 [Gelidibacter sp.]|nr:hypothetical protein [Gelidibacter sp.]